jgi:RNA polymerase sigma-B factor
MTHPAPRSRRTGSLDDAAVDALLLCWAESRDAAARARLVEHYDGLATAIAVGAHRNGEPVDDLVQVAREALLHALDRYDPSRGIPFTAFARPTIEGTIKRHFRDVGWALRIPRRSQELAVILQHARERLAQDLGRQPTLRELAAAADAPLEEVELCLSADHERRTTSLDAPVGPDPDREPVPVPEVEAGFLGFEQRDDLQRAMAELDDRQRWLLHGYYVEERTQRDLAAELGVSQMQVSRLLASSITRLRASMRIAV